ncbi:hypothetical protein SNEBB_005732 [Seison nebaliae]|nr:hypothetical protein SNEBB_005732 [Seison nebaliae]
MVVPLTKNAIVSIYRCVDYVKDATFQFIKIRPRGNVHIMELNDGTHTTEVIVQETKLTDANKFNIVRISDYSLPAIKKKTDGLYCMYIRVNEELKVIDTSPEELIGNPVKYDMNLRVITDPKSFEQKADEMKKRFEASQFKVAEKVLSDSATRLRIDSPMKCSPRKLVSTATIKKKANFLKDCQLTKIESLTPYDQSWAICGRVTMKGDLKKWSNAKGEGCLFNFNMMDDTGTIRMTAFKAEAEKFFELIEHDKVYLISDGRIRVADTRFNKTGHNYEVMLSQVTDIKKIDDDEGECAPVISYDLKKLSDLKCGMKMCDVVGIIKMVNESVRIISKQTGREIIKRDMLLVDETLTSISLTMWNRQAEELNETSQEKVIILKDCAISDFNGISLSCTNNTSVKMNEVNEYTSPLIDWWSTTGKDLSSESFRRLTSVSTGIKMNVIGTIQDIIEKEPETPEYLTVKGTVLRLSEIPKMLYKSCPTDGCNKKVKENDGQFHCDKCNSDFDSFTYRTLLRMVIGDSTNSIWVNFFNDQVEKCLDGMSAKELGVIFMEDEGKLTEKVESLLFRSMIFRLRFRMETYEDDLRLQVSCVDVSPIDTCQYARKLLKEINA